MRRSAVDNERRRLRATLKERALRRADRDRKIAEEWFPLDQEAWDRLEGFPAVRHAERR